MSRLPTTGSDTDGWGTVLNDFLSVALESTGSLKDYKRATLSLSSAQIKALNTTPIQIVAAPGANKVIVPIQAVAFLTYIAPAYVVSSGYELAFHYSGQDLSSSSSTPMAVENFLSMTESGIALTDHESAWQVPSSLAINGAMKVGSQTGNPTTGNGTVYIEMQYSIVTLP